MFEPLKFDCICKIMSVVFFVWCIWENEPRANIKCFSLTLKLPITTIVVCFVTCLWFLKSFFQTVWTYIRLVRSSLIWVHTVSLYAKIGLKRWQEYSADDIKQMTFSDAGFLGVLRVNKSSGRVSALATSCTYIPNEFDINSLHAG